MMKEGLQHLYDAFFTCMTAVKRFFTQHATGCFFIAMIFITIFRISIGSERGLKEFLLPHDDLLFLQLAHNIANGNWLGEFNSLTLAKSCIFPCYIALSMLIGLPYLVFIDLTICAAAFLGVMALSPRLNRFWSLLLYTGLIFNPAYLFCQRLIIQDLFSILASGMIFCLVACWIRRDIEFKKILPWIIGCGLFFALLVHTRWEGLALIAVLIGVYVLFLLSRLFRKDSWRKIVVYSLFLVLIPVGLFFCVNLSIKALNKHYYGIAEFSIRNNREYKGFIGSLLGAAKQLDPAWDIRIPLRRKVLKQLYGLSPTFKKLKFFLDRSMWHQISTDRFPPEILKKEPDLISNTKGGFVQWELLNAMSSAGYFKKNNWKATRRFMKQVVRELKQASAEGKLPGFKPRYSNLPPYSDQMIKCFFTKFSWDAKYLFLFGKKFIETPSRILQNDSLPLVQFYFSPLKNNNFTSGVYYCVSGWGHLPQEKNIVREQNFAKSSVLFYHTMHRPGVQRLLTKSGYPNIPVNAGFSFFLRDRHLKILDNQGKIIFDGDVLQKRRSQNVFLDNVVEIKALSVIDWKRRLIQRICSFCQMYGGYISLLSALMAVLGIVYGVFHGSSWRRIGDLFFSACIMWGTGFMYFCLIIFANVLLHCARYSIYFIPTVTMLYSACLVFILGGLSILCSGCADAKGKADFSAPDPGGRSRHPGKTETP